MKTNSDIASVLTALERIADALEEANRLHKQQLGLRIYTPKTEPSLTPLSRETAEDYAQLTVITDDESERLDDARREANFGEGDEGSGRFRKGLGRP